MMEQSRDKLRKLAGLEKEPTAPKGRFVKGY
jgi:hypothetical protein